MGRFPPGRLEGLFFAVSLETWRGGGRRAKYGSCKMGRVCEDGKGSSRGWREGIPKPRKRVALRGFGRPSFKSDNGISALCCLSASIKCVKAVYCHFKPIKSDTVAAAAQCSVIFSFLLFLLVLQHLLVLFTVSLFLLALFLFFLLWVSVHRLSSLCGSIHLHVLGFFRQCEGLTLSVGEQLTNTNQLGCCCWCSR